MAVVEFGALADENLMEFIQAGDVKAFETLVERHHRRFYRTAYRIVMGRDDAEDVVQEAFLKLWHRKEKWDARKRVLFTTWFHRVIYNQAIDLIRKRPNFAPLGEMDVADEQENNEQKVIDFAEQKRLRAAMAELPENQRAAVNYYYFEEMKQREIADVMHLSVKALESLLTRAKATLRQRMEDDGTGYQSMAGTAGRTGTAQ